MRLMLDTNVLGKLCHPSKHKDVAIWLETALANAASPVTIYLPEIADYELRRELLRLIGKGQASQRSIDRLDNLATLLDYLPLSTAMFRRAAQLWADVSQRRSTYCFG
jgi:predicted nucleic acid-binding protein